MYDIYTIADYAQLFFIVLGLLMSWKVATARWFFLSYLAVIIINMVMFSITIAWNTHYYIFQAFLNIVFILPIVYRRDLALFFYSKTGLNFYQRVYEKQKLSTQECMILLIFSLALVVNISTWLEVLAYKYYWIDNAYFKLYFRDNIILLIQLALCGCLLMYATKAESRELKYESIR
ncbi:hypothetical protein PCIT_a1173 [Pseudoalteromonas citrea]|uniref:Uncharacterized protein n=2 Tax=Pseudoalteromonas citrea TaxID=43655 RepID=A0AAD4AM56_9GAMM|nr:hypothetical protein [Pseudoalteromonas citrea]KAF7775074.1 hypothetical protein PCIT_a1173 [Pseudoalteromonas citrea]